MKKTISMIMFLAAAFVNSLYAQNVARVGDTEYATLRAAYNAVSSGGTITMIADETVTGDRIYVSKSFTLDLNGCKITSNTNEKSKVLFQLNYDAELIIEDSSQDQQGIITCNNGEGDLILLQLTDNSTLIVNAGSLLSPDVSNNNGCCIVNVSDVTCTLVVNGGILKTTKGNSSKVGVIYNYGTTTINGGTIQNTLSGSTNTSRAINNVASLTVKGGEISSSENAIFSGNNGTLVLWSGASITGNIVKNKSDQPVSEYILDDNAGMNLTTSLTASKVTYNRGSSNAFGTVCLPFVPDAKATITYYTLREATESTLTLEQVNSPAANTPYVYFTEDQTFNVGRNATTTLAANPSAGTTANAGWTLKGVYGHTTVYASNEPNSYYIKSGSICKVNSYFTLKPFRAYFIATDGANSERYELSLFDDATAVSPISGAGQEVVAIRNLQGVSLGKLQRGINIVTFADGQTKKVIVK